MPRAHAHQPRTTADSARLDVLYVGTLPPHPGGSAMVGADLLRGLAARGHHVRAVAPITPATRRRGEGFRVARRPGAVTWFTVPRFENAPNTPPSARYRALEGRGLRTALARLIDDRRPDVVVIGRETFAWHVPDVAERHQLPTVLLAQGATSAGIRLGTIAPAIGRRLIAEMGRADRIVLVAHHLRAVYRGWGLTRLHVIQNGVDRTRFTPQPKSLALLRRLRIDARDVVVLHASNLKALKRPLDIVDSARRTLRENPRLVYVIAGDGNLRAEMTERVRRYGLTHAFRFVGWVPHDDMPHYLALADIVVMPSEAEALALVYLETLAAGRVLLASDIPAAREVVRDGRDGVRFRKGDVDALAARTLHLAARPQLRTAIAAGARARSGDFAIDAVIDRYAVVLTEVVRGTRRRSRLSLRERGRRQPASRRSTANGTSMPARSR